MMKVLSEISKFSRSLLHMNKILLLFFLTASFSNLQAQSNLEPCGQTQYIEQLNIRFPGYRDAYESHHQEAIRNLEVKKSFKNQPEDTIFSIPVVFHILYRTPIENVHDSLIISQMKVLNDAFRRLNSDTIFTRDIFKPIAADARINFYLAAKDPLGNPTNGITRTQTTLTTFYNDNFDDRMKFTSQGGKDAWDPTRYLNIWVCNHSNPANPNSLILGYATPPTNAAFWSANSFSPISRQGVVLHYPIVGKNNPANNGSYSIDEKSAVHEVGHYLGLRHTWGDGNSFNGCSVDDGVFDTPNTRVKHSGCNKGLNTCGAGTAGDMPDQAENYMDYSSAYCTNMFTQGQVNLMRYNLNLLRSTVPDREFIMPESEKVFKTTLYPNPSNGVVTLEMQLTDPISVYKISIKDLIGQEAQVIKSSLTNMNVFDLSGLASGMYFFELYHANGKRLIRQKILITGN